MNARFVSEDATIYKTCASHSTPLPRISGGILDPRYACVAPHRIRPMYVHSLPSTSSRGGGIIGTQLAEDKTLYRTLPSRLIISCVHQYRASSTSSAIKEASAAVREIIRRALATLRQAYQRFSERSGNKAHGSATVHVHDTNVECAGGHKNHLEDSAKKSSTTKETPFWLANTGLYHTIVANTVTHSLSPRLPSTRNCPVKRQGLHPLSPPALYPHLTPSPPTQRAEST